MRSRLANQQNASERVHICVLGQACAFNWAKGRTCSGLMNRAGGGGMEGMLTPRVALMWPRYLWHATLTSSKGLQARTHTHTHARGRGGGKGCNNKQNLIASHATCYGLQHVYSCATEYCVLEQVEPANGSSVSRRWMWCYGTISQGWPRGLAVQMRGMPSRHSPLVR